MPSNRTVTVSPLVSVYLYAPSGPDRSSGLCPSTHEPSKVSCGAVSSTREYSSTPSPLGVGAWMVAPSTACAAATAAGFAVVWSEMRLEMMRGSAS